MDSTDRATSELPEVRVTGTHRRVAMRASDWEALHTQIPRSTFFRLHAALKRFCGGCDNMSEQVFRRCPGSGFGRLEEFVADGVQVIGRRGNDDQIQTFFTTEVRISPAVTQLVQDQPASRQQLLPLELGSQMKGTER